jgi:hypothetical protein
MEMINCPRRGIDIGFGQGRTIAALGAFVPRTNAWVETVRHLGVGADSERALAVAHVGCHERGGQGFLFQQAGDHLGVGIDRNILRRVFHQDNASGEPGLNVAGSDITHFMQVIVEIFANCVALQVVVIKRKQREGGDDDKGGSKQDFVAETQVFIHGLKGPLRS